MTSSTTTRFGVVLEMMSIFFQSFMHAMATSMGGCLGYVLLTFFVYVLMKLIYSSMTRRSCLPLWSSTKFCEDSSFYRPLWTSTP